MGMKTINILSLPAQKQLLCAETNFSFIKSEAQLTQTFCIRQKVH